MNRRIFLCAVSICMMSMSVVAALPPYNPMVYDQLSNELFAGSGYQAYVTTTVYQLDPAGDGFLYTYLVSGATTKFTWFSVAFNPGTTIIDWNYETPGTAPFAWEPVDDVVNANSIEAFFKSGLTSGNSALLWYTCSEAPAPGIGALAKLSSTGGAYAEGLVLVPQIPEPMTLSLLGLGFLAMRSFKRK